jgi:hypothetical protein
MDLLRARRDQGSGGEKPDGAREGSSLEYSFPIAGLNPIHMLENGLSGQEAIDKRVSYSHVLILHRQFEKKARGEGLFTTALCF